MNRSSSPAPAKTIWPIFPEKQRVRHAFQKKTQQTRKEDIALAAARHKQLKEGAQ